jgi:hypothetical protein
LSAGQSSCAFGTDFGCEFGSDVHNVMRSCAKHSAANQGETKMNRLLIALLAMAGLAACGGTGAGAPSASQIESARLIALNADTPPVGAEVSTPMPDYVFANAGNGVYVPVGYAEGQDTATGSVHR